MVSLEIQRKCRYLFSAVIALPACVAVWRQMGDSLPAEYYFGSFLQGLPPIQPGSRQSFLLPGEWCLFCIMLLYFNGKNAKDFAKGMGLQIFVRMEKVDAMWKRKCVSCFFGVCIYFLAAYAAIGGFCAATGQGSRLFGLLTGDVLIVHFFIPLLAAYAISIWQLVLSMRTNALLGVICGVALLTVSAYSDKWYLPGNYLMKLRVEEFLERGIGPERMILGLLTALAAGIWLGKHTIRNMDYIQGKGDF